MFKLGGILHITQDECYPAFHSSPEVRISEWRVRNVNASREFRMSGDPHCEQHESNLTRACTNVRYCYCKRTYFKKHIASASQYTWTFVCVFEMLHLAHLTKHVRLNLRYLKKTNKQCKVKKKASKNVKVICLGVCSFSVCMCGD